MLDLKAAKEQIDFLEIVNYDTRVDYVARTKGGEYHGPCPICGGEDRFFVQPEKKYFKCRSCGINGDVITYLKEVRGMSFREASEYIGVDTFGRGRTLTASRPVVNAVPAPPIWADDVLKLAIDFCSELWGPLGKTALQWLHDRKLNDETIQEFLIGWNWKGKGYSNLWFPRGWTIPSVAVDGLFYGLKFRKEQGDPKYPQVRGSQPCLMGRLTGKSALLITEGEFDMMLAWQKCKDIVDVATLGSADYDPMPWALHLLGYKQILVCYDLDEPGEKGRVKWSRIPSVKHIRLPMVPGDDTKDITDFVKTGGNLRDWVSSCIGISVERNPRDIFLAWGRAHGWPMFQYGEHRLDTTTGNQESWRLTAEQLDDVEIQQAVEKIRCMN